MSESSNHLEAQVKQVMSQRGTGKGTRGIHVQCFVCSKMVRKLRLHIRKSHKNRCLVSCPACPAKFVGQNDLSNHQRNGCPRASPSPPKANLRNKRPTISVKLKSKDISLIDTFLKNVDFSESSAVNVFITKYLQLDEPSRNEFSEAVDRLYGCLQRNLPAPFSLNKLVKGGSVGKGTAVKDKADIDCVVFLNNVKTMEEHKSNLQETKDHLQSCLGESRYKGQITFDEQTHFAVKFKFRLDNSSKEFHIDLLPTFTTDQSREQLYEEIFRCTTEDKGYYSAHFVSLQKEFVKDQPPNVKNLIRLVKYWRKTCIEDKSNGTARLPSSYPLELITIACWEKAGKPSSFDIRVGFKAVLGRLISNCQIRFIWDENYSKAIAERGIKGMESKSFRPFVLDPANPTNNVCITSRDGSTSRDAEGWKTVANVAKMTLRRQPLKHVFFNKNWEII